MTKKVIIDTEEDMDPPQLSFQGFAPTTVRFHLFSFEGMPYRARFENGRLIALCTRKGSLYSWMKMPAEVARDIYLAYLDKVKPLSMQLTKHDPTAT